LLFYDLDIMFLRQFMELPTLSTNFIEFKPNCYNIKNSTNNNNNMIRLFLESYA